ncbi:hypothetical protein RKD20_000223 [Streptomyces sp. SLBN-8D4]
MPGSTAAGSPPVGRAARPTASWPTPTSRNPPNSANAGHVRPGDRPPVCRRLNAGKAPASAARKASAGAGASSKPAPDQAANLCRHGTSTGRERSAGRGILVPDGASTPGVADLQSSESHGPGNSDLRPAEARTPWGLPAGVCSGSSSFNGDSRSTTPSAVSSPPKPRGRRPFPVVRACGSTDQACGRAWLTSCRARPGAVLSASPGPERRGSGCSRSRGCCRRLRAGSAR